MTRAPTEMELRVAKILLIGDGVSMPSGKVRDWIDLSNVQRNSYLKTARAAIRAMRVPTTEMLREAGMVVAGNTEAHATVWETMIDAASPEEE